MIADGLAKGEAAADGTFELVQTTDSTHVAMVGSAYYDTLTDAFAALNETNYSLTLLKDDAWTKDSIYWQAGTSSGYADSLKAAIEAASEAGDAIKLVCKPGADIADSSPHINVTKDITVYANGAEFGGDDLSIGTFAAPEKTSTTVNIYCAKNLVVWGGPDDARADIWNVNFVDCVNDGWNLLMYRGDESGEAQINLTLTNCKASGYSDSTIHTTADGSIKITGCTFTDNCAPVNIAHKQAGTMEVIIENSTFTKCGSTSTTNSLNQYAAPIRFANNGTGTLTAVVDTVTITDTVGVNGDILLGDGRTGKTSTVVSATITGTDATVQVQYPGDWAGGTLNENVTKTEVTASSGGTFSNAVAKIGNMGYTSLDAAITAAQNGDTITILQGGSYEGTLLGGLSNKEVTIKAASGVDVKFDMSTGAALHGAKITFEDVTFEYKTNKDYIGLQHTDTMVYKNCVFNGQMFLYGASETFNGCTFTQTSANAYNVWTYGAKEVDFNGCKFNCAGKSVLVYNEGANSGTDLTVTGTTFYASQSVDGKAAIEIDTSLMKGQTKITVDQATANNITGFGVGSKSGSSLWNNKKNNAQSENITVTVAEEVVLEPEVIDFDAFIKRVEASEYTFDGTLANGKKLTVKWSPVSGCFDLKGGSHQLGEDCPKIAATGNTPNRWQDPYAQYQLFASATDLSISNVNFVYVPAKVSVCMNGSWGGKDVTPTLAELQLNNSGDTSFAGCTFDKVTVSPYGKGNNNGNTNEQNIASFTGCKFANVTDKYAIKDVYAGNVTVENCTFTDCGGGIYLEGNAEKGTIDISGNEFVNIGSKGLIQFSASGDYTKADITLDGNTATNFGPILRQLNQGIADNDVLKNNLKGDLTGLGGKLTYTSDSVKKKTDGNEPAQPTVYTVKFENADVAEMKVIEGTKITLPTPGNRPNYKFEGWYVGNTKVSTSFEVTGDVTLVAQWRYIDQGGGSGGGSGSSSTTYQVSVDKAEGGKITVSPTRAEKGDTVTITVKPDEGYELGKLTVTDKDGDKVTLTQKDDNKYTFKMPAGKVTVKATFTEIVVEPEQPELPFSDVAEQDWFYDAVVYVYENELMNGTSATAFSPSVTTSRAMMLTMLARYDGVDTSTGSTWYEAGAAWAVAEGVSDGTNLEADLTREQLVTMLWRYAGSPMVEKDLPDYPDRDEVSDWAVRAMVWAVDNGIITGNGAGELNPQGSASRAEVATILMRFIQL